MSIHHHQNSPLFLLYEINSEITEIQKKLLALQSRLFEAKESIIQQNFQNESTLVLSESSEEIPIPF